MVDDPAVAVGDRVMELVDDDVVETVGREPLQNIRVGERAYTREQHVRLDIEGPGHQESRRLAVMHLPEDVGGMDQDLPAMGDEEYAAEGFGVLRGDERLPYTGGRDDQGPVHTLGTGAAEGVQCGHLRTLGDHAMMMLGDPQGGPPPTVTVLFEDLGSEWAGAFGEQMVELLLEGLEGCGIHLTTETVVPLHTVGQGGCGDVRGADDDAIILGIHGTDDVGLRMESDGILGEQPDLYVAIQGHELLQRERGCDPEVGTGEDTDTDTAVEGGDESVGDQGEAGFLEEGDDDINRFGCQ